MKHWIDYMNAMAAGLLFDGGYVVAPTRHAGESPGCEEPREAPGPRKAHDAGRAPRRPSTKLAVR